MYRLCNAFLNRCFCSILYSTHLLSPPAPRNLWQVWQTETSCCTGSFYFPWLSQTEGNSSLFHSNVIIFSHSFEIGARSKTWAKDMCAFIFVERLFYIYRERVLFALLVRVLKHFGKITCVVLKSWEWLTFLYRFENPCWNDSRLIQIGRKLLQNAVTTQTYKHCIPCSLHRWWPHSVFQRTCRHKFCMVSLRFVLEKKERVGACFCNYLFFLNFASWNR